MEDSLLQLGIVIVVASVLGVIAKMLRQPIILAYVITGTIIAYSNFFNIHNQATFRLFSDLGIMFLLFLVGLEINYTALKAVGKTSLVLGVGQVLFTSIIGFSLATLFNFSVLHSIYIAVALTFSSTIIVIKLLSEKKDMSSLYGKISVGMLLVQDFIAVLILVVLAGITTSGGLDWLGVVSALVKAISLFALMLWLGRKTLPFFFDRIARSQELLFLISLAWVFVLAAAVSKIGLSIEIAGFLAGLALANSAENFQISSKIRPLRDFFMLIFFALLGSSFVLTDFSGIGLPIIVFSLFVLIGNPLIVLMIMGFMGYRKRTSFLTGLTVAQISEFSLVLATLGLKVGHINEAVVSLITAVGIITIVVSTYLIVHADKIFRKISQILSIFERRKLREDINFSEEFRKSYVLIGAHRTGQSIAASLPKEHLLVIDFDPDVVTFLKKHGYEYIFGDVADPDIFEKINFEEARLVISTNPDFEDNMGLLEKLKDLEHRPKAILRADEEKEAELLYAHGADYVLLPHFTAGQYLGKTIAIDPEMKMLDSLRRSDLRMLKRSHMN